MLDNILLRSNKTSSDKEKMSCNDINTFTTSTIRALSQQEVKPLGLFFWGNVWTLTGWCDLREAFRNFRLDRIQTLEIMDKSFKEQSGQRLDDYIAMMREQSNCKPR